MGEAAVDDVFSLFELLLTSSRIRHVRDARPVVFIVDGNAWRFDPRSTGKLFAPCDARDVKRDPLVLRCHADLLMRLVKDDAFELTDDDEASFDGDLDHLLPIAAALDEGGTALGLRAGRR